MARELSSNEITAFLEELGKRYRAPAVLYLVGGGALLLLENQRRTLDLDYVGSDLPSQWTELQRTIDALANEIGLRIEAVPLDEMLPLSAIAPQRHLAFGAFGSIQVYIYDPYAIALSKLDRGTETDLQDIVFLAKRNYIDMAQLGTLMQNSFSSAEQYNLNPKQMETNLDTVRKMLRH